MLQSKPARGREACLGDLGTRLKFCLLLHFYLSSLTSIHFLSLFYLILIYLEGGSGGGDLTGYTLADKREGLKIFLTEPWEWEWGRWEKETGLASLVS